MLDINNICLSLDDERREYASVSPEIVQTSNFKFKDFEHYVRVNSENEFMYTYTRGDNPTLEILENKIAALEHGECARSFASGMGAISACMLSLINQGEHIVVVNTVYGSSVKLAQGLSRFGVECTKIDVNDTKEIFDYVKGNTKMIYFESPSSQKFEMLDLEMISSYAKEHGIITVIDNTWSTPLLQNPLLFGIDVVIHSCSKYIGGHSDLVGGIVVTNKELMKKIEDFGQILLGATMSPMNAWLALRGLRTLPVRLKYQEESIRNIIDFLEGDERIERIYHPLVHTSKELREKYLKGYGSLCGFVLKDVNPKRIGVFINALKHITLAYSWGGFESLIIPVFKGNNEEELKQRGLALGHMRMYVGLEDSQLIIDDLRQALDKAYEE